ncbi:MAG: flagellar export protein FliJ [Tepidisphaeraceae bacterium]|jgi:flagellar FliJ protein
MPKFTFTLDGPLRQRRNLEQMRQRELAIALKVMQDLQDELRTLNDAVRQANEDIRAGHMTGAIDMNFLAAHRRFIMSAQRKGLTLMQRIALAQREVTERRATVVEAAKQTKVLEKLREHQWEAFRVEHARKEFAELDEIGTQIACRTSSDDSLGPAAQGGEI